MTGNAVKSNRFAYTYTGGPHGRHYEAFREEVCRTFGKLDIEPGVPDRLDCGVEIVQVGSLSMGTARGSSGRFLRSRATLSDGCDDFGVTHQPVRVEYSCTGIQKNFLTDDVG